MEFGLIKSKIESLLSESYGNGDLKRDMFVFNELVLKDKNISKLFSLYSDLSENRGYDDAFANEFIKESIDTIKKIKPSKDTISNINMWVSTVKTKNEYKHIDNLVSENMVDVEEKIKSKNTILESLKIKRDSNDLKNVSLNSILEIANKTVSDHLNEMDEKTKRDLNEVLYESEEKLKLKFEIIKESIGDKLQSLKESETDQEVLSKIEKTLDRVASENFNKLNYIKLKELYKEL